MTFNAEPPDRSPLRCVNTLQGTDSHYGFSRGNCLPLTTLPFAMVNWTPQTDESAWVFDRRARKIQGVRATHQPSPWMGDYGHLTVMAQTGDVKLSAGLRSSTLRPDGLVSQPHFLSVYLLRYQTQMEVTPTERGAVFRFTFPATDQARVIFDPFPGESGVEYDAARGEVRVYTRARAGGAPDNFACYYVATFSRPVTRFAPFQGDTVYDGESARAGERVGAFAEFEVTDDDAVEMKVATSFISHDQARLNLQQEIGTAGFQEVKDEAEAVWRHALSRIEIDGATGAQRRTFYTCLYRAQLYPRPCHEYTDEGRPIHYSPYDGQIHDGVLYTDNGFWDTYRTVYPFLALLLPERLAEILEGWTNGCKEGGWFPQWASPGYRACMIGTHIDAVMADAYVKGVRGFDVEAAYAGMLKHASEPGDEWGNYGRLGLADYLARGYVPADTGTSSATSRTLDYAYDDFCLAQIAGGLGREDDFRTLIARADAYKNVYDPETAFMRGRCADGSWQTPFDPLAWGGPYVEGGAWQSTWAVPHDPAGLIALMGGPEAFVARLDEMLTLPPHFDVGTYGFEIHEMTEMACADFGQYAHSNQPVHHVLYLYAAAGRPWKTQHWVRRVLNELYSPDVQPGDEDNGELSCWYILSALGFYPLCPGHPSYVFGSPLFPKATVHLPGGKTLTIEAPGNTAATPYVQSVKVNGHAHENLWVAHDTLMAGGTLQLTMGAQPRETPVTDPDALPFSLSTAPRT